MCGIAGIHTPGVAVDERVLARMVGAMHHRGPDGDGFGVDADVGLGMRRLAIVDLAGGGQPLHNEDGSVRVVFNGELYNHVELRGWLEARSHTLRSHSDGEVVSHLYEELGDRFAERLNGIFAIAIWDARRRVLVLARDQLGVKPLYYHEQAGTVRFASELKALLQDPAVPRELDAVALDHHLTFRFTPAPRTLLRGVRKLEPATVMTFGGNQGSTSRRYWSPAPAERRDLSFDDAADELRHRLAVAVDRQMMSDRPIGAMLSGGIDSAAVVAMMARSSGQVKTFTIGFEGGGDADETALARETARLFATEHEDLILPAADLGRELRETIEMLEEPVGTSSAGGFRAVSRLASAKVPVLLSGQGADELLAGYWRYTGEWIAGRALGAVSRLRLQGVVTRLGTHARSARLERGLRAVRHPDTLERFMNIYAVFDDDQKRRLYAPELVERLRGDGPAAHEVVERYRLEAAARDPLGQMQYVDTRLWLPDDLLLVGDKMSMAESVEMRVPFLDPELVEFVESLPTEYKLRRGRRKAVFKHAMRDLLPREIVHRKERGFATPVAAWLRGEFHGQAREMLLERPALDGYFDRGYVERLLDEHRDGRADHTRRLFGLVTLDMWAQIFLVQSPAEVAA